MPVFRYVFESKAWPCFYQVCSFFGWIDFIIIWKLQCCKRLSEKFIVHRLLESLFGLGINALMLFSGFSSSEKLFILCTIVPYPVVLFSKYLNRPDTNAIFLNSFKRCLRRIRKLRRIVGISVLPWTAYISVMWKVFVILIVFVIELKLTLDRESAVLCLVFFLTFQSVLPTFVQTQCVCLELAYLLNMMVKLNTIFEEALEAIVNDLEKSKKKIKRIQSAYQNLIRLIRTFNKNAADDLRRMILIISSTLVVMLNYLCSFEPFTPTFIAWLYVGYLWDLALVLLWHQELEIELLRYRVLNDKHRSKVNFGWHRMADTTIFGVIINEIDHKTYVNRVRLGVYSVLISLSFKFYFGVEKVDNIYDGHK